MNRCKTCPISAMEGQEYCATCAMIAEHEGETALIKPKADIGPFEKRLAFVEERLVDVMDMLTVILKEWQLYDQWMEQKTYRIKERESGRKPGTTSEGFE